jgi:hypothetical protein
LPRQKNPPQTEKEYQAQRLRDKEKHDREMLTCPIDNSETVDDNDEESDDEDSDKEID